MPVLLLLRKALELQEKNNLLLDLLGEKTEDLEAVQVREDAEHMSRRTVEETIRND